MGNVHRSTAYFSDTNLGTIYVTHMDVEEGALATAPDIDDVGDAWKTWWNVGFNAQPAMKTFYKTTTQLDRVTLRRIKPLEPVVQEYTTGLPIAGTATSDQLDPQASILVSLRTAKIGRSYRGRMYLPSPTETIEESYGAMSADTAQDIADNAWGLVLELDNVGDYSPVVFSALLNEGEPITRVLCDRRFRTQRRRAVESTLYVQGV